ncbi:tyrosine-type recombinase/integrase [Burkholderia contaminans]|nr:tyrosine-type recombinase/integrase [Burkholderia contaminans]WFN13572.1 tyrosine-type recombinase/integrase [Burkholderia contaminans]
MPPAALFFRDRSASVAALLRQIGLRVPDQHVVTDLALPPGDAALVSDPRQLSNVENVRFHDVRHTWASWHVQSDTPHERLKELGGWSSYDMVLRYARLAPDHLAQHTEPVTVWSEGGTDFRVTLDRHAS